MRFIFRFTFVAAVVIVFMGAGCGKPAENRYPGDQPYVPPTAPPPAY